MKKGSENENCDLFQILSPSTVEDAYLHVPPVERQFLISPPASPPVGWEQPKEDKPVVDYDLLSAMASLSPGKLIILLLQCHCAKRVFWSSAFRK